MNRSAWRKRLGTRGLLAAAVLLFAGCEVVDRPRREIPEHFAAHTLTGEAVDRQFLHGKPWVVNLWVPGCGICIGEMPDLEKLKAKYESQGINFLAISLDPDEQLVVAAAQRFDFSLRLAVADSEALAPLGVGAVPSTVFIDRRGIINAAVTGAKKYDYLDRRTAELLAP